MSVGVIRAEVEIYLDCDVEDADAKKVVEDLPIDVNLRAKKSCGFLNIADIKVKDLTVYDGVPVEDLYHPDTNGQ